VFVSTVDVEDLRHLSTTLSTLASEKQKAKVIHHYIIIMIQNLIAGA